MFRNCFTKVPVASVEMDEELKKYIDDFYKKDIAAIKQAKHNAFTTINKIEKEYNFKTTDEKFNKKQKEILVGELGDAIIEVWES
jgi:hypothetical protein